MKKLLLIVTVMAAVLFSSSCKKAIQQKEENIILQAMTTGVWYVELYQDTTTDVTAEFSGYTFQFFQNNTVNGIIGGATKSSGTWTADINNYTITANFPIAAGDTLRRLNYTWKISDSYLDYVVASAPTPGGTSLLHLRKQP